MVAVSATMARPFADAARHAALVALAVEAPPRRVHARGAVRAAPGAGGRHEAGDQEGHQRRQNGREARRSRHRLRRLSTGVAMPPLLLYRFGCRVSLLLPLV